MRDAVRHYLGPQVDTEIHWAMVQALSQSVANTLIVPFQDVLGLDSQHRMNVPGQARGCWTWRFDWTMVDASPASLRAAQALLPPDVHVRCATFIPGEALAFDLAVLPLALRGDRARCYAKLAAPRVLVHDWCWRRAGASALIPWLGKRINLLRSPTTLAEAG